MACYVLAALLFITGLQSSASQVGSRQEISPSVSISLPSNVPSDTVQIFYHMVGPFGGSGGRTEQRTGLHSYEVVASVEGKAATEIRTVVYASGCEIETFVIPLANDSRVKKDFACEPVQTVILSGQIVPNDLVRDKSGELIINYVALWAHSFFGIVDGAVAEIRLATLTPDANGMFQVELPKFREDRVLTSSQPRASLHLMLRDSKTWNPIAYNLEPELPELRSEGHDLRILSDYPSGLKFKAWPTTEP